MPMPTARDLMTPDVLSVPPETPILALAHLMAERHVSAVPVLSKEGQLLGLVSEADLIRRLADEEEKAPSWFAGLFADPVAQAERYARTHGVKAADVMTTEIVSVAPEDSAAKIAKTMEDKHVRRVLVVKDGKLMGIVSRADLLRALVAPPGQAEGASDEQIRRAVVAAMRKEPWVDTFHTVIEVKDGVVEIHGFSRSPAVQRALRVLAEGVPGVKDVKDMTQPMPAYLYAAA
ncbi:MAG: CBS domain-containing protein [Acetobacteraceae bacterium]|nr:CBS domain-containing protein [Acetobacteraceae bacterium]MDW8398103.1 CBS domain-containing protein [Acetobacteraceae bacterium]